MVGSSVGLGHSHVGARPRFGIWMGFWLAPFRFSALRFLVLRLLFIFHLYSNVCPVKHVLSNTSGTMSIVNACVKSLFISPILDLNWRIKCDR